jgi:uncharacterized protein (DUF1778 family)
MYNNRNHVRENAIKVRFSNEELEAISALASLSRKQKAAFIYDAVMRQIAIEINYKQRGV